MNKAIVGTGAILAVLAVILGAIGAHALRARLGETALDSFQTGVTYLMYHALFLMVLGGMKQLGEGDKKPVFLLVLAGVFCFSFSIFALTTGPLAGLDFTPIGWITPIGGILLIAGWGLFIYRVFRGFD